MERNGTQMTQIKLIFAKNRNADDTDETDFRENRNADDTDEEHDFTLDL